MMDITPTLVKIEFALILVTLSLNGALLMNNAKVKK